MQKKKSGFLSIRFFFLNKKYQSLTQTERNINRLWIEEYA